MLSGPPLSDSDCERRRDRRISVWLIVMALLLLACFLEYFREGV